MTPSTSFRTCENPTLDGHICTNGCTHLAGAAMGGEARRPGRPRKWSSEAERMRAYRAARRAHDARLVDPADAPAAAVEVARLREIIAQQQERIGQLEDERDRMWAYICRLQAQIREIERGDVPSQALPRPEQPERGPSRAERRRAEREAARRHRREGR